MGLRNKVFKAILRQDTAVIAEHGEHAIQGKLEDVYEVRRALFDTPMRALQNVLAIIGEVWYLSVKCPGMLGPAIMTVVVAVPVVKLVQNVVQKKKRRIRMMTKAAGAKTTETLQNLSVGYCGFTKEPTCWLGTGNQTGNPTSSFSFRHWCHNEAA